MIVHVGFIILAVAVTAAGAYSRRVELELVAGQRVEFAGHTFEFKGTEDVEVSSRVERRALIELDETRVLTPALQQFNGSPQTVGTPAIATSLSEDVYLSIVALPEEGSARIVVVIMPLAYWLWTGGAVMGFGTILAIVPTRSRRQKPTALPGVGRVASDELELSMASAGRP